jgi:hypothetical protein
MKRISFFVYSEMNSSGISFAITRWFSRGKVKDEMLGMEEGQSIKEELIDSPASYSPYLGPASIIPAPAPFTKTHYQNVPVQMPESEPFINISEQNLLYQNTYQSSASSPMVSNNRRYPKVAAPSAVPSLVASQNTSYTNLSPVTGNVSASSMPRQMSTASLATTDSSSSRSQEPLLLHSATTFPTHNQWL